MSTLLDLRNELQAAMGGRDDDVAVYAQNRGINAGIFAYALTHEPPELRTTGSLAIPTSGLASTSSLTRLMRVEAVYNSSGSRMYELPFYLLDRVWLPDSPEMLIYSLHGETLHCRPKPSSSDQVTIYYLQYPQRLVANDDNCPFEEHEDFILAFAAQYAWMYLEEGETSDGWLKIANAMNMPESLISTLRKALQGPIDYNKGGSE